MPSRTASGSASRLGLVNVFLDRDAEGGRGRRWRPEDPYAEGITARELEVLELLTEAMPERLFQSHRTVERPISNITVKVRAPERRMVWLGDRLRTVRNRCAG